MASININKQKFKNIQNELTSSRAHIFDAINVVVGMNIPNNLYGEEAYFLNHLREKLDVIVTAMNNYDNWIDHSLYQINDLIRDIHKDIVSISDYKLEARDNSVLIK